MFEILLIFSGICLLGMCYATTYLGAYIDKMETPKSGETPWLSKPGVATKISLISLVIIMTVFISGGLMCVFASDIFTKIIGIVFMVSSYIFAFIVLIFSMAAMKAIRNIKPIPL